MFLLDTNVISELRKLKPHGALLAWYASHPESAYKIPSIALYEVRAGVEITRRQDSTKAAQIEQWLNEIILTHPIEPLGAEAAIETARLMHGRSPDLTEDAMIAAIARVNGYTVATRNTKDFRLFDVPLVNPFLYGR